MSDETHRARGINSVEQIAGSGYKDDTVCLMRALFWESDTASPVDLGATMPAMQTDQFSRSEAVSDAEPLYDLIRVVGQNTDANVALVWERESASGTWCVADLNDVTLPCTLSRFELRQAHDVNTWGHVTGLMADVEEDPEVLHAFVLTCRADLNGDFLVDSTDVDLLLGEWDTAHEFDIDCIGVIDGADLGLMIGAASEDDFCNVEPICTELEEFSQMTLDQALDALSFSDVEAFVEWWGGASSESQESVLHTLHVLMTG